VPEVVEEPGPQVVVLTQQAGVGLGEQGGEPLQRLLRAPPAGVQRHREQQPGRGLGAPGRLDHETVGRQQRASRHQRCHTPDRRHGGDLARQQHAAGERRRSAAGKANHGAAVQAQVPDQLTQVACTGGDRSRWVKARPAASGPVRNNQS
jgi:hypothetical protein